MPFLQRFKSSLISLYSLPEDSKYVIAYSGGVDSHVLLHCCFMLKLPVRAVHVHHGLQDVADDWVVHCQGICDDLNIPLDIIYIDASKKQGQSPEETARIERYAAIQTNLQQGDCLLTAQHLNDQAETLLLQLFRTASSAGLAAMPALKSTGGYQHLRPLLSFSRHDIDNYATENGLHWKDDPSNQDNRIDRNFIRNELIPLLNSRWPECVEQLATVAALQSNSLKVQEDMAAVDLANTVVKAWPSTNSTPMQSSAETWAYDVISVLSISTLKQLSTPRLLNVLRYWIKQAMNCGSSTALITKSSPTRKLLLEIEKTLINSQRDAVPVIVYSGFEYRKYQNNLYLLKAKLCRTKNEDIDWLPSMSLKSPTINSRKLMVVNSVGKGLKKYLLDEKLKISFRRGGEQFHPVGRRHSQRLKKLFQEANIPPWERNSIPLLYWRDKLVAVVGFWVAKEFAVVEGESGWVVEMECL